MNCGIPRTAFRRFGGARSIYFAHITQVRHTRKLYSTYAGTRKPPTVYGTSVLEDCVDDCVVSILAGASGRNCDGSEGSYLDTHARTPDQPCHVKTSDWQRGFRSCYILFIWQRDFLPAFQHAFGRGDFFPVIYSLFGRGAFLPLYVNHLAERVALLRHTYAQPC